MENSRSFTNVLKNFQKKTQKLCCQLDSMVNIYNGGADNVTPPVCHFILNKICADVLTNRCHPSFFRYSSKNGARKKSNSTLICKILKVFFSSFITYIKVTNDQDFTVSFGKEL